LVERNAKDLLSQGVTGPEGFLFAHSESAEETATLTAVLLAGQVLKVTHKTILAQSSIFI